MKISLFSQSLFALPLHDAIQAAADAGYRAIELACTAPHLDFKTARDTPEEVAACIRNAGLDVAALSLFNTFTEPSQIKKELEMAELYISLAPVFGTRLVKMTPGPPASHDAGEEHWHCLLEAVNACVPMARNAGVKLAFETHMRQLTDTLASSERFLEMAPKDCVGLTVDFSNLRFAGENMPQVISRLKDCIFHTHIKNGYIEPGGGWHFGPLDTGLTDYAEVFSLLREIGYDGYLSAECLGPEAKEEPIRTAQRDLTLLERYLKHIEAPYEHGD